MKTLLILTCMLFSIFLIIVNFESVDGYKTGSYHFCTALPAFPDCTGWRTEAISDSRNFWFCDYVELEICESKPKPDKQIMPRNENYCCRFIGSELEIQQETETPKQILGRNSSYESIAPLIIWTDKDHYNFRDKVTVYGKFDFTNALIKKNLFEKEFDQTGEIVNGSSIQTGRIITETPVLDIDIKLNGRTVLRNIPVHENGWFVSFFHLNDRYHFANQNNVLSVDYLLYSPVPLGGPRTSASYQFTTGDIAEKDDMFDMWINDSQLPNKIEYGINVKNPERFMEMSRQELVKTRLVTPQGYIIPIDSTYSVQQISREYKEFTKYGYGEYEIQVTYGNNISKENFEYKNPA